MKTAALLPARIIIVLGSSASNHAERTAELFPSTFTRRLWCLKLKEQVLPTERQAA